MTVMTVMGGQQISFVNLASCSLDIFINAATIHFITSSESSGEVLVIPIRPRYTETTSTSDRTSSGQRYTLPNRQSTSVNLDHILNGKKESASDEEKGEVAVVLARV